jgi:hypothetical protein
MLPSATASALAVGSRTVFATPEALETDDLRALDLDTIVNRFATLRAADFNPGSLKEYGRRVHRAWELLWAWKADPATFNPRTRTTRAKTARERATHINRRTHELMRHPIEIAPSMPTMMTIWKMRSRQPFA